MKRSLVIRGRWLMACRNYGRPALPAVKLFGIIWYGRLRDAVVDHRQPVLWKIVGKARGAGIISVIMKPAIAAPINAEWLENYWRHPTALFISRRLKFGLLISPHAEIHDRERALNRQNSVSVVYSSGLLRTLHWQAAGGQCLGHYTTTLSDASAAMYKLFFERHFRP